MPCPANIAQDGGGAHPRLAGSWAVGLAVWREQAGDDAPRLLAGTLAVGGVAWLVLGTFRGRRRGIGIAIERHDQRTSLGGSSVAPQLLHCPNSHPHLPRVWDCIVLG